MDRSIGEAPSGRALTLSAETLTVSKQRTAERVLVRSETRTRDVLVDELLSGESIVVERVPVGRYVDAVPDVREEGDCTILPVVEEEVVIVRRLLLREEVHLRRVKTTSHHVETVTLREQHAVVTRTPVTPAFAPISGLERGAADGAPALSTLERSMPMSEETIVAVFDTLAHADAAVADLRAAGLPDSAISRHVDAAATTMATRPTEEAGFWSSLFGGTSADEVIYDRSMASGGSVVVVKTTADQADLAIATIERHHPIDLDERAESYGLGATSATNATIGLDGTLTPGMGASAMATPMAAPMATTSLTGTGSTARLADTTGREGVLSLAEETLSVGKRLVNQGGTRIRRYVVERPAEADVLLRSETIQVERRPVTGADGVADFSDKTIEMTATGEEAVVGKTSRIVEEVALRRDASERTETVHDTVRRQEIEVEQLPASETAGVLHKP